VPEEVNPTPRKAIFAAGPRRALDEERVQRRAGPTKDPEKMRRLRRCVQMDAYSIEDWSLWMDLKILAKTPLVGFVNRNAF
jgi:lipopolysaccharide/colanic/teichoic acid biosynthesis glycosyltransferase